MSKKNKLIINKNVNHSHEIFDITEKRAYEIFNDIFDRINNASQFKISNEIEYLYKKYTDINEFVYAVYVLGHQTRAAYVNKMIMMPKEINSTKDMILNKYFENDSQMH